MQQSKKLFRDLILLLFGIAGIAWFFYSFQTHHPFTVAAVHDEEEELLEKADSVLQSWQYESIEYFPSTEFKSSDGLIDSLQKKWGVAEFKKNYRESAYLNKLPLMSWEVSEFNALDENNDVDVRVEFTPSGEVVSFYASNALIQNQRPFNRYAIRSVFQEEMESYSRNLEDSLITALSDYQHLLVNSQSATRSPSVVEEMRATENGMTEDGHIRKHLWDLTDFYLERTVWKYFEVSRDSMELMDEAGFRFGRAYLSTYDSSSGVQAGLTMDLLPAGSMKSISYSLSPQMNSEESKFGEIVNSITLFLILLFGMWLLFVFYLRIKARALDTKPAIIIAVLAGFMVPGFWLLQFIEQMGWMYSLSGAVSIFQNLMILAMLGAVSAVGFFVLTAVSDSITRQYWPEKLKTWDLLRRGLLKNKPVGRGIINALAIGGILAGLTGLFLSVFPTTYIPSGIGLISDKYFLPSIANLMVNICFVLVTVVPVFLILGNQVKGLTGQNWIIPLISALLFGIIDILPFSIEPELLDHSMRAVIGFLLGYFYLRFDFLTVVFGVFIFVNLLTTSRGWVLEGSPDANTFYLFMLVMVTTSAFGVYFILKGSDRDELPEYVPAYIEDQAKEQRLKQELSIARVVQQTFLPSKIHHLPGIDIAGICIPAQETGGDYYDMISLGEQRTAIAIGDVSGKGIRAAFYMTFTKGVLHSLSALILSPVELLNQLNRLFSENATRGTFISMIYGILEADKRQFTFARAGHNPMLVVRANGESEWLKPDGIGIGIANGDSFLKSTKEATLKLNEGDVVILYTDGITEMLNTGNHFYEEDRLERLVKGVRKASSEKILQIIIDDVNEFKGLAKQHDDMTLVIIKADASVNQ